MEPINITGFTKAGQFVKTIHLTSFDGMRASILTLGARVIDLRLSDNRPLTLPLRTLADVEADTAYVGVAVGRTANRIRGGKMPVDGKEVALQCNENGQNHIHGGWCGFDKRLFSVRNASERYVELYMHSPDGDQGYPSSLEVIVRYELTGHGELVVSFVTTNVGQATTVTNMTMHPYFDLQGHCGKMKDSVRGYKVMAPGCDKYLVLDEANTTTGEIASVENTKFDFRTKRKIDNGNQFTGYDQFFVSSDESSLNGPIQSLVTVFSPAGKHGPGVEMEVSSNQPGFQMYTANGYDGTGPGAFDQYGSIAIEPSGYIDAENHPNFPSMALEASQTRQQLIKYRFRTL